VRESLEDLGLELAERAHDQEYIRYFEYSQPC
jgi:hypothetical protein